MKAYRLEILVVDHDDVGDRIKEIIEDQKYPNHCINPMVMDIQSVEIGEWDDDHPLNTPEDGTQENEFRRLFPAIPVTPN